MEINAPLNAPNLLVIRTIILPDDFHFYLFSLLLSLSCRICIPISYDINVSLVSINAHVFKP